MDQYRERVFWRRLGEIFHYIADYFTFPHNKTFTGSLVEHNSYEKELIRHFLSEGSSVYIQMVPDSERVLMKDLPGFQL